MRFSRRTFHRFLLLGASEAWLRPSPLSALTPQDWHDLAQPFVAQIQRLLSALAWIGEPLPPTDAVALKELLAAPLREDTVQRIEAVLNPHVLLDVTINPESRISMTRGAAKADLVEHGWRSFLVRVNNQARDTSMLRILSPQALPMGRPSGNDTGGVHDFTIGAVDAILAEDRWLALNNWTDPPLAPALSGLAIEYRIVQLYSRDRGRREASLQALTGQELQDLGFRSSIALLFDCRPAQAMRLNLREGGRPVAAASLRITDTLGRVFPAQSKRALPDLWFQPQVYRLDGEDLVLPPGSYTITYGRGPEYLEKTLALEVTEVSSAPLTLDLERWIVPSELGYFSGDTHIHAAGCSHYESPSEGVTPEVMDRQIEGEALDLGAVLTWAPGFLYQSQFFSGHVHTMSPESIPHVSHTDVQHAAASAPAKPTLRYDLEISGFPCSHCGHLVLLNLKQQNYPGTVMPEDWPSWNLPILEWAKAQGAVTGYAHSGHGMVVDSTDLPNYVLPAFDSCGANEYLVDITHDGLLDFISGSDLWPFTELNLWYHVLNCGFALRFAGETDFPCITDHAVGGGRSYVQLDRPPLGDAGYTAWLQSGLQHGRSYFGDGRSHIFDFHVDVPGARGVDGTLDADHPATAQVTARVAARLEPAISAVTESIRRRSPYDQPFWHLERARIGNTRSVAVDLIVNGEPTQRLTIAADGALHDVHFTVPIIRSSWIALRIFPSAHTNPVTVRVAGKPVRASAESARWCRAGVDVLWRQKSPRIRTAEIAAAARAYDHARATYDRILAESAS